MHLSIEQLIAITLPDARNLACQLVAAKSLDDTTAPTVTMTVLTVDPLTDRTSKLERTDCCLGQTSNNVCHN